MNSQSDPVLKIRKEWEALLSRHEKDTNTSSLLQTTAENIKRGNIAEAKKTWDKFTATNTGRTARKDLFLDLIETYASKGATILEEKGFPKPDNNKQDNKKTNKEPLYPSQPPIPSNANQVIEQITTEKKKEEDKKTAKRIEGEKKQLIRRPEETKDKLFNEAIKKLSKELLYNVRVKKQIPANLPSRTVKRTVVEHYVDQEGPDYRLCEKTVFDNWCKNYGTVDKKDSEFRHEVDNTFLTEKRPDLLSLTKEIELKKDEVRLAPKADFFVKHILIPVINNFLYQDTNENKGTIRRKLTSFKKYPKRYFVNKGDKKRIIHFLVLIFSTKLQAYKQKVVGLAPLIMSQETFYKEPGQSSYGTSSFYNPTSYETPGDSGSYYSPQETSGFPHGSYRQIPQRQPGVIDRANNMFSRARNLGREHPRSTNLRPKFLPGKTARNVLKGLRLLSPAANPATMVIILIILLVLMFFFQGTFGPGGINDTSTSAGPVISLTKTADNQKIDNGGQTTFTIAVNYSNVTGPITITDPIPDNADFVSCDSCTREKDSSGKDIAKWIISPSTSQDTTSNSSFDQEKFTNYGFPEPDNSITMDTTSLERWKKVMPQAVLAAQKTGVDVGILGWWAWKESGGLDYCFENCVNGTNTVNNSCYCSLNAGDECLWQVGIFGNHPQYTIGFLESAMNEMHPGLTPQQVGQAVIDQSKNRCLNSRAITSPNAFPNYSLSEIVEGATNDNSPKNKEMKSLIATLYKDDGIGAYLLAKHFLDIGLNSSLATRMLDWDKEHKGVQENNYYNSQKVINHIKAIYNAGISGSISSGASGTTSLKITLKLKDGIEDAYIINQAFAETTGSTITTNKGGSGSTIVIDPGHSGGNLTLTDPTTNIKDVQYHNVPETEDVFDVAVILKNKLETAGYKVIMTKNKASDTVSHRKRADIANNANASLAVSIHTDSGAGYFGTWGQVYPQKVNLYREDINGNKASFTNNEVAALSQTYAATIAQTRSTAEGTNVSNTIVSFDSRDGLAGGNIPLVQLWANVPWVYNEAGGPLTEAQKNTYAEGIFNGILKVLPINNDNKTSPNLIL